MKTRWYALIYHKYNYKSEVANFILRILANHSFFRILQRPISPLISACTMLNMDPCRVLPSTPSVSVLCLGSVAQYRHPVDQNRTNVVFGGRQFGRATWWFGRKVNNNVHWDQTELKLKTGVGPISIWYFGHNPDSLWWVRFLRSQQHVIVSYWDLQYFYNMYCHSLLNIPPS